MKFSATILLLVWGTLLVQPGFANMGGKPAYGSCSKAETNQSSCSSKENTDTRCKKQLAEPVAAKKKCNSPEKKNCSKEACNPTLGCSSGNFFIHQHHQISIVSLIALMQKGFVQDDNRISDNLRECWHPPEA